MLKLKFKSNPLMEEMMPNIMINGLKMHFEIHGKGHPLVLIAGFGCDIHMWDTILEDLKAHFQVIVFDNRDSGRSGSTDHFYTILDLAQDTSTLIENLNLEKPHLLGHSMGGSIAQTLAYHHRNKFNKLILSNTFIKLKMRAVYLYKFILDLLESGVSRNKIIDGILPWLYSHQFLGNLQKIQALIDFYLHQPPQTPHQYQRQLEAILQFDSTPWFKKIKGPALVIGGDEDILCPQDSEILASYIEEAKFVDFHQVGHCPMIEKPKEFSGIVINYLK